MTEEERTLVKFSTFLRKNLEVSIKTRTRIGWSPSRFMISYEGNSDGNG